jgi:hypothetical protein
MTCNIGNTVGFLHPSKITANLPSLVRIFLPVIRDSCFVQLISYAAELVGANPPEWRKFTVS